MSCVSVCDVVWCLLVLQNAADVDMLMPHFMAFMSEHFPELSIIDRLREVSDLSSPAQWYVSVQTVCVHACTCAYAHTLAYTRATTVHG